MKRRPFAFVAAFVVVLIGPVVFRARAATADDDQPAATIEDRIGGRMETLRFTGDAVRKKLGIGLYRIASYCDDDAEVRDVDALAAADVPKRLVVVMQRDVADWILRQGFTDSFAANDPAGRFGEETRKLLDHLSAASLDEGDTIVLTHAPGRGVECRMSDRSPLVVGDVGFSRVVWNVFMGPKAVTAELRRGLGERLSAK